jgi:hypothetical protein
MRCPVSARSLLIPGPTALVALRQMRPVLEYRDGNRLLDQLAAGHTKNMALHVRLARAAAAG